MRFGKRLHLFGLVMTAVMACFGGHASAVAAPSCREIFFPHPAKSLLAEKWWDLLLQQRIDANRYSSGEIRKMNRATREALESIVPTADRRASTISYGELTSALEHLRNHSMTRPENRSKYQPDNVDIGYCFGRATYMHLLLLRMGLDKNSMIKVWAVGEQKSDREKNWGFHVAVAVHVRGYGWMTIDSNVFKIQPIRHWFDGHQEKSIDGKLRIYVTEADKFGVTTGGYDRVQMGLDLKRDEDWYRGYFTDMLSTLRGKSLEELDVPKIKIVDPPRPSPPSRSLFDKLLFGF